jgi:hypothetical protein
MLNEGKHLHGSAVSCGEMLPFVQHDMDFHGLLRNCYNREHEGQLELSRRPRRHHLEPIAAKSITL